MEQKANVGLIILSICFPIVGIILGIVEMNKGNKEVGKKYLMAAIISAVVVGLLCGCCVLAPILLGVIGAASEASVFIPALF